MNGFHNILQPDVHHLCLLQKKIRLPLQLLPHPHAVERLVALRPRTPDRRPPARIQQPKLNPRLIRHHPHHPAQRVDLPHQVPLRNPANRRIARHLRNQIQVQRKQCRAQSHPRRRHRRLATGVPRTHNDDIVLFRNAHSSILCVGTFTRNSRQSTQQHERRIKSDVSQTTSIDDGNG